MSTVANSTKTARARRAFAVTSAPQVAPMKEDETVSVLYATASPSATCCVSTVVS